MRSFNIKCNLKSISIKIVLFVLVLFLCVLKKTNLFKTVKTKQVSYDHKVIVLDKAPHNELLYRMVRLDKVQNHLPSELTYRTINEMKLHSFLKQKNSILMDEPYFSAIIAAARQWDIHPLLLFAILGQEQGFVPKDNPYAEQIANNPFNVFGSWKVYNTNIIESSEIAAKAIVNLSEDRPSDEDVFKWINLRGGQGGYAEDETWWMGVKSIFEKLKKEIEG